MNLAEILLRHLLLNQLHHLHRLRDREDRVPYESAAEHLNVERLYRSSVLDVLRYPLQLLKVRLTVRLEEAKDSCWFTNFLNLFSFNFAPTLHLVEEIFSFVVRELPANAVGGLLLVQRLTVAVLYIELAANESFWINELLHVLDVANGQVIHLFIIVGMLLIGVQIENDGSVVDSDLEQLIIDRLSIREVNHVLRSLR